MGFASFLEQARYVVQASNHDIGVVDFSVKDGKLIPWEVNAIWTYRLSHHFREEGIAVYKEILNRLLLHFGLNARVDEEDTRIILEEGELICRFWTRPPYRT